MQWLGQQAVVTLPEHIDRSRSNADRVREQLLLVINRGAVVLIADQAANLSCDYSGADALARAYRRAVASGTELEPLVIDHVVRRVVSLSGLEALRALKRQVSDAIYQRLKADARRAAAGPGGHPGNDSVASVAGLHPADRLFGQATPGPAPTLRSRPGPSKATPRTSNPRRTRRSAHARTSRLARVPGHRDLRAARGGGRPWPARSSCPQGP